MLNGNPHTLLLLILFFVLFNCYYLRDDDDSDSEKINPLQQREIGCVVRKGRQLYGFGSGHFRICLFVYWLLLFYLFFVVCGYLLTYWEQLEQWWWWLYNRIVIALAFPKLRTLLGER